MNRTKKRKKILLGVLAGVLVIVLTASLILFWHLPRYYKYDDGFDIRNMARNDGEITVMSCNVRCLAPFDLGKKSWFYRADLLIENIEQTLPDIIGFQEVTKTQYRYLNRTLQGYDNVIEYRDNSVIAEGCPVYYRMDKYDLVDKGSFWLSETPDVMSKDWNAAHNRICSYVILSEKSSGQEFVVFNTHLDHVSDEARVKGIAVVLDKIAEFGGIPAVLMGDLNAEDTSETYRMAAENFLDAKQEAASTMDSPTYQNWGTELNHPRIDYIMVSKQGFAIDSYFVVDTTYDGVYTSDHFPVCAKLRLVS